jgi:hypothetical protein
MRFTSHSLAKRRLPTFAGIPALAETPGFEDVDFANWFGLFARTGTRARSGHQS